ncbi:MAG: tetratricopeptide repeat protein [Acidobacteriota bacterium]|nr:tetratricopeptide repeat protein [Acidobacteriota bacterium]
MNWLERLTALSDAARLEAIAAAEGSTYGPLLLQQPPGDWRGMMRSDPHYRSYGTLQFLLENARARFENAPTIAREITAAVLDFVDEAKGPSHIHNIGLRGLAQKEHANACEKYGDLGTALTAAERSVEIYGESPGLLFQQTRAQLVVCKILREMGETNRAMELARRCAEIFTDFEDATFTNMARMFEAGVLYSSKRFTEALAIFTQVSEHAERTGDRLTVARCLQCVADCARELGDLDGARDLYPRALAHFEALNIPSDANRTRWALALTLAASGKVPYAISELFKVRAVFLSLGMNSQAASAVMDVVRIKFDVGEDVRDLCAEIVPLLTKAGLTQNAVEALAYIREQAKHGRLTTSKITKVRTYFDELATKPLLLFARPREEEEG